MDASGSDLVNRILLLFLLLAFINTASADDYYVSTTGDNTTQGNITHPWQNVSYATQQADAGDTIHLFDGIWYNEECTFANSGNATHPIILTAYNGTPELDGIGKDGIGINIAANDYIEIRHLKLHRYHKTIDLPGSYVTVANCDLSNTADVVLVLSTHDRSHNTIENCTVYDSGWNTIQLAANREPGAPATYITVRNCTIYNSSNHNAIDLYGNFQYVTIEGNELYANSAGCIFEHDDPDHREYVTIRDNNFHDTLSCPINIGKNSHYEIYNNTFTNTGAYDSLYVYLNSHDYNIYNNSFYNSGELEIYGGYNFVFDDNYIHSDGDRYRTSGGADIVIKNPRGFKDVYLADPSSTAEIMYDDGTVFTAIHYWLESYVPVRYHPTKSNTSGEAKTNDWGTINTVTAYNITLVPANAYLESVTVAHESDIADDRTNISADSSVSTNPTTITATMQNASHTYNVSVDGVYTTRVVSDLDKVAQYQYSGGWSTAHSFEFDWYSVTGYAGAPDPTNLQSTKSMTWVNHTWSAGSGNVTDSYNVSRSDVWWNDTFFEYCHQIGMSPETWSNITVWAFNNTGGISQNSISQNIQTDAAGWSPSDTAIYYNTTSPIEITTKADGTNLFSRTPTEADGNATTSFKLVVTT